MTNNDLGDSEEIDVFLGQKVSNPEILSKKNNNLQGVFLLFCPKKWLSVRLHSKSHQKSFMCQNFSKGLALSHI